MSLLITGIIDGPLSGGVPKAIEFTATENIADLSVYGVESANNGNQPDGREFTFPAISLLAGDTFYLASEVNGFTAFFGFAPDATSGSASVNGDDAIILYELIGGVDTAIDAFGVAGVDGTGEPWDYLDGWAYRNDGAGASTVFNPADWTFSGTNALDGETSNASAATPFPVGTYSSDGGPTDGSIYSIAPLDAELAEGDSGDMVFSFLISRAGDTDDGGAVDFAVTGADVEALDFGGALPSGTVTFDPGQTEATLEILVAGDDIMEDDEDFSVELSNPVGGTIGAGSADGRIINDDLQITLISEIQGNAATWVTQFNRTDATPFFGETVMVEAVVVGDFQDGGAGANGDFNGFYLQEEDADADGDATTSEGVFIFDGFDPDVDVEIGDRVVVTGVATEFFGETQINAQSVTVVESGVDLPTASTVEFPVADTITNSDGQLIADLEAYEGMLVTIPQTLTVGDLFGYGRFGEIGLSANGRVDTYTQNNAPSVDGFAAYVDEQVRATVVLDDGSTEQNPEVLPYPDGSFGADDDLTSGDTVQGLTGVVRFSRGSGGSGDENYRINPTEEVVFENTNPREETPPEVGGRLQVATFNVLNFFTTLGDSGNTSGPNDLDPRGADDAEEFERQLDKLVEALSALDADVLGLIELENEYTDQNGDGQVAIQRLVDELNAANPDRDYAYADPGTDFGGGDAIMVGVLYDRNSVEIAEGTTVEILTDEDLPGLGLDFGNPVFDGPGTSRAPIAVTFEELATGATFTVSVNHFKSKGSVSPFGNNEGIGDGTGNNNEARDQAAQAVEAWLATDPTGGGTDNVLILGDLNAYRMEDPVQELLDGADNTAGTADDFVNLDDDYTFGFPVDLDTAGQVQAFGSLDYALASSGLADQVTGAATWHINADEPSTLDYNTNFRPDNPDLFSPDAFRSSDHDPIIIGLDLDIPRPDTALARLDFRERGLFEPVIYSVDGQRVDRDRLPIFSLESEIESAGITISADTDSFDFAFVTTIGRGIGVASLFGDRRFGERSRLDEDEVLVFDLDEVDGLGDAIGTGIEFARVRGEGEVELSFFDDGDLVETVTLGVEDRAVDYDLTDFASFDRVEIGTTDDLQISVSAIEFDRLVGADTLDFV